MYDAVPGPSPCPRSPMTAPSREPDVTLDALFSTSTCLPLSICSAGLPRVRQEILLFEKRTFVQMPSVLWIRRADLLQPSAGPQAG